MASVSVVVSTPGERFAKGEGCAQLGRPSWKEDPYILWSAPGVAERTASGEAVCLLRRSVGHLISRAICAHRFLASDTSTRPSTALRQRTAVTNQLWQARKSTAIGLDLPHGVVNKHMKDSLCEAFLPFASDLTLRDEYLTAMGTLRVGKLLEDLDAMAGTVAFRHADDADDNTRPLTIVTASVDRIDLINRLLPEK